MNIDNKKIDILSNVLNNIYTLQQLKEIAQQHQIKRSLSKYNLCILIAQTLLHPYIVPVPNELLDPISKELLYDPYVLSDGRSYNGDTVQQLFTRNNTRVGLNVNVHVANSNLQIQVIEWMLGAIAKPPVFTSDWFSPNLKQWNSYQSEMKKRGTVKCLEIGAFEGRSTLYMLKHYCQYSPDSSVDTIDTWEGSAENDDEQKHDLFKRFQHNLQPYLKSGQCTSLRGYSSTILPRLMIEVLAGQRPLYDFIYIDGSHDAKDVMLDATFCWEILKQGGILAFDDYEWHIFPEAHRCPKAGIDGFLNGYQKLYKIRQKEYQVHIQKL
jgi:hypothetical protein